MDIVNHKDDPDFKSKEFLEALYEYNQKFESHSFTVSEIRADLNSKKALEKMKAAIQKNEPIDLEDESFFDEAAFFDFYEEKI